ncbi:hypothetical protein LUZ63_018288 [Rhynchospora breviuscula]|uniref:1-phosphatidylinositol-4-phosphate 5-kinase n=1 Tax=Rhynchospora breviuscula TaxID=2022672 RepID=A0A9Q0C424_9POAL|nr:hypothetical protein LUZ63_018288 [Rhynchospora breviuscula]
MRRPDQERKPFGGRRVAPTACTDAIHGEEGQGGKITEQPPQRICIWECEGEAGYITCDFVDSIGVKTQWSSSSNGGGGNEDRDLVWQKERSEKVGRIIREGHRDFELMRNLQLGIRYSVGKASSMPMLDLRPSDFNPLEKFSTRFPAEGSKSTPPHSSREFRWKDYCPMVFRHLRRLFSVDPADYLLSICGNDNMRELSSHGKSGSMFYLTNDSRFMIKTIKKSELRVLIRMLPSYYKHVYHYENSLLTKFYGVHSLKSIGGQKIRFVIMGNIFWSEYRIHRRFDLKGSSYGRTTVKVETENDGSATLKDLDLNFVFQLPSCWHKKMTEQLKRDSEFLESERIMDYSFLVGVHFRKDYCDSKADRASLIPSVRNGGLLAEFCLSNLGYCNQDFLFHRKPFIQLGAKIPARAERSKHGHEWFLSDKKKTEQPSTNDEVYNVFLFFGIIDILQDYDISKKLEHAYKSFQADPNSISAVDPKLYSRRFRDFISKVFVEN